MGKTRTALELLRLSAEYKTRMNLEKKYKKVLIQYDKSRKRDLPHVASKKVWICWLQGIDQAPELVQKCIESVRLNLTDREVVILTEDNIKNYVKFPSYIIDKWKRGIITNTHFTDLLRLELLIRYGGLWLDATVFCSENSVNIPQYYFDSDLFFYQTLKPGRDGKSTYISSWLLSAKSNNNILMATRRMCYAYWKTNNHMVDYFLLHDFFSIALDYYSSEWSEVVPRDNSAPHILLLRLFEKYDGEMWAEIRKQTPFHKLSYKFDDENFIKEGTYYKKIIGDQL